MSYMCTVGVSTVRFWDCFLFRKLFCLPVLVYRCTVMIYIMLIFQYRNMLVFQWGKRRNIRLVLCYYCCTYISAKKRLNHDYEWTRNTNHCTGTVLVRTILVTVLNKKITSSPGWEAVTYCFTFFKPILVFIQS